MNSQYFQNKLKELGYIPLMFFSKNIKPLNIIEYNGKQFSQIANLNDFFENSFNQQILVSSQKPLIDIVGKHEVNSRDKAEKQFFNIKNITSTDVNHIELDRFLENSQLKNTIADFNKLVNKNTYIITSVLKSNDISIETITTKTDYNNKTQIVHSEKYDVVFAIKAIRLFYNKNTSTYSISNKRNSIFSHEKIDQLKRKSFINNTELKKSDIDLINQEQLTIINQSSDIKERNKEKTQELIKEIKLFIAENEINNALDKLLTISFEVFPELTNNIVILKQNYIDILTKENIGIAFPQDAKILKNQVLHSILHLTDNLLNIKYSKL